MESPSKLHFVGSRRTQPRSTSAPIANRPQKGQFPETPSGYNRKSHHSAGNSDFYSPRSRRHYRPSHNSSPGGLRKTPGGHDPHHLHAQEISTATHLQRENPKASVTTEGGLNGFR